MSKYFSLKWESEKMSKIFVVLLMVIPISSSERRAIVEGNHNNQKKSLISRFIQGIQTYSTPMSFGGIMGTQLCITLMDTAAEEGCSSFIEPLGNAAVCCCVCGTCCAFIACNECRKEWKKHVKKE